MRKGFTLIELLVVITILAVLAGAILPYVQQYVEESRISKAKTDLEEIGKALTLYEFREGAYTQGDVSLLTGRYINKSPIDPWGTPYKVAVASGVVYSYGPDRKDGGNDDVTFAYQPPLALVSVTWYDRNQNGIVDGTLASPDEIQLVYSRNLGAPIPTTVANFDAVASISNTTFAALFIDSPVTFISSNTISLAVGSLSASLATPGVTLFEMKPGVAAPFKDLGGNVCLASQPVLLRGL